MASIIKSYKSEEDRISDYVRNPLESINPDDAGGSNYADSTAILAEARLQAEVKVQEAYAEGLRCGEEAGAIAFSETIDEAAEVLGQLTTQLHDGREAFHNELQGQVLEIARMVASKILRREVQMDSEVVGVAVRGALEKLSGAESILIRVNPQDLEHIVSGKEELLGLFGRLNQLDIVSDDSVESGGCIAESEHLHVDAQLTSQVNSLIDNLMDQSADGE